jgi:hypothetical protein
MARETLALEFSEQELDCQEHLNALAEMQVVR